MRLRVGEDLYEMRLEPATDQAEFDRGLRALAAKYPFWQKAIDAPEGAPPFVILRYAAR